MRQDHLQEATILSKVQDWIYKKRLAIKIHLI